MSENPYQSSAPPRKRQSLWEKFWLAFAPHTKFLRGEPVVFNGILFHVDTSNEQIIFAACPTTDASEERVRLISEEISIAHEGFLNDHATIRNQLVDRAIEIHLIRSYDEYLNPIGCLASKCTLVHEASFNTPK